MHSNMDRLLQSSSPLITLFSILLLTVIYGVLKLRKGSKPKLPPGPWRLPIIGSLHHLFGVLPHRALRDLARTYGPLMHLQFGELTTIVVSSPELAKEVMKANDLNFAYRPELVSMKILTYNYTGIAFAPYGEYWRQLRRIGAMELLSAKRVQSFRWIREEEGTNLVERIASSTGLPVNVTQLLQSATFTVISMAAFGNRCSVDTRERFIQLSKQFNVVAGGGEVADIFPSRTFLHSISRTKHKIIKLHQEIDQIMESIITEHREARRKTHQCETTNDLLDVLLDFEKQDYDGFCLTTNNIKAVTFDVFIGGGETSATTLDWAMAEIMKTPRILEKAQAEVRQVFGRAGEIREDGLTELKYLKLVITEVLRLHPPGAMLLPREGKETCEINGYVIPKKARVIINAWAIGRDPKYWNEPETFNPERFLNSPIDFKGNNFEYIPFGAGRRVCPGQTFALLLVEYLLAVLLYHFDWKLPDGMKTEDIDMTESFGVSIGRKHDLCLIPIPHNHQSPTSPNV